MSERRSLVLRAARDGAFFALILNVVFLAAFVSTDIEVLVAGCLASVVASFAALPIALSARKK